MNIKVETVSPTLAKLTIHVGEQELSKLKIHVLQKLAPKVKVAGFREGKVPMAVAEKHLDPNYVQNEVIEDAVNHLYADAVNEKRLRVVAQPKIELTKFVPYTELEFIAEVETIGTITLPDYKKTTVKKEQAIVTAKDIEAVITRLQTQAANYTEVSRAAKLGDRATIDFEGTDAKGEKISGGAGSDYPLVLGSNTFIPGFEEEVVGHKVGDEKSFVITFPKDYGAKALQSKKVTFEIKLKKLEQTELPPLDEAFAKKVGPFTSIEELKADVKKQLLAERETQNQRAYEDALIKDLVKRTKVTLPTALLQEQMDAIDKEFRQTLAYRGETYQEYVKNTEQTAEQYRENELKPAAEERVKAGLILSEIAEQEQLQVSPEELEIRLQILKGQHANDPQMLAELDKPENKREIASRLLTEKTIAKLVVFAGAK